MDLLRPTESERWAKFKSVDNDTLSMIYGENSKRLYQYGLKLTPNHSIIGDAIQEIFCDLVRNRKNIGDTNNIQFYLIKSFKRKLLKLLQKEVVYLKYTLGLE